MFDRFDRVDVVPDRFFDSVYDTVRATVAYVSEHELEVR